MAVCSCSSWQESPSPKTVSLTFSIQVSGHFFLLQRSQTGRRVGTNLPAFLPSTPPRQNKSEGDT